MARRRREGAYCESSEDVASIGRRVFARLHAMVPHSKLVPGRVADSARCYEFDSAFPSTDMLSENDRAFYQALAEQRAKAGGRPPADLVSYRAMFDTFEPLMNAAPLPAISDYLFDVPIGPGCSTDLAVPNGNGPFPVLVHCHGNGGLAGSALSYRRFSHDCARRGFLTFMIDYRLAPENPFPACFEDMVEAVQWVSRNAAVYGGNPDRLCLSGNSSGAGLAFAVARSLATLPNAPRLRGLVGLDGRYDRTRDLTPGLEWMLEAYLGPDHATLAHDPRVSPSMGLRADALPPVQLIGCSGDHTAPSTLSFAQRLLEIGATFQMTIFEGAGHDFMRWPHLDIAKQGFDVMFGFLAECTS